MKLSKTSAHAAIALAYLANRIGEGPVQARQIAGFLGIPTDSALKILQALSRGRLIQSQLGRAGGYRFHRPPADVSLLDIVETIDGPIAPQMPITDPDEGVLSSIDLLQTACQQAALGLRTELSRYTVADLAHQQRSEPIAAAG